MGLLQRMNCFSTVNAQPKNATLKQTEPSFTQKIGEFFTKLGSLRKKSSNSSQSSKARSKILAYTAPLAGTTEKPMLSPKQNHPTYLPGVPPLSRSKSPKLGHVKSGTNLPNLQLLALHGQPLRKSPPLLNSYDSLASLKTQLSSDEELTDIYPSASYLTLGDDIEAILEFPTETSSTTLSRYGSTKSSFDSDFAELESLASQPSTESNFTLKSQADLEKSTTAIIKEINDALKQQKAEEAQVALPAKPLTRQASGDSATSYIAAFREEDLNPEYDGPIDPNYDSSQFGNTDYGSEATLNFSDKGDMSWRQHSNSLPSWLK